MAIFNTVYGGTGGGWKPGANTLLYVPMNSDLLDHSGNSVSLSTKNTPTIINYSGVMCAYLGKWTSLYTTNVLSGISGDYTVSAWVNMSGGSGNERPFLLKGALSPKQGVRYGLYNSNLCASIVGVGYASQVAVDYSGWHLLTISVTSGTATIYWDSSQKLTYNVNYNINNRFLINNYESAENSNWTEGYYSNWIVENKVRTATEVSDYYNQTKSNYGL